MSELKPHQKKLRWLGCWALALSVLFLVFAFRDFMAMADWLLGCYGYLAETWRGEHRPGTNNPHGELFISRLFVAWWVYFGLKIPAVLVISIQEFYYSSGSRDELMASFLLSCLLVMPLFGELTIASSLFGRFVCWLCDSEPET